MMPRPACFDENSPRGSIKVLIISHFGSLDWELGEELSLMNGLKLLE